METTDSTMTNQIVKKSEFQVFRDYISNVVTTIMDINEDLVRLAFTEE